MICAIVRMTIICYKHVKPRLARTRVIYFDKHKFLLEYVLTFCTEFVIMGTVYSNRCFMVQQIR